MSQVTIRRPFGELDLGDQLRSEPHTVFHFFFGQGPMSSLPLQEICEGANSKSAHQTDSLMVTADSKLLPTVDLVLDP